MPPKMPEVMQFRENRLETFENGAFQGKSKQKRYWTHDKPSPEVLADHGFYFTPTKLNVDQITCYNCKRKETNVGGVENIAAHHLEGNPNCSLSRIISQQIQHLTSDLSLEEFWDRSDFKDVNSKECVDMRKKTFGLSWKFDGQKGNKSTANSMALARAGFYYCPLRFGNDRVQCVYCNSSLDTWSTDDIPIEEHKANSPGCYFLQKYTLLEIAKPKKEKVKPKREQNAEGNKSGEPEEKVNKRTKEKNKPSSNISSEILIENIKVSKRRGAKSRILDRILDSEAEEEEDDEEKEDENANAKEKEKVEEKETTIVNEDEAEEEEK